MNTVQRIAKNTIVLLVSDIISKALGFFYVMYTARYLGAEGFGVLSFALAFTGIFGVFTDLGLQQLTVREVARDKSLAGKYLGNIAVMKVILVVITFGLIALTINLLGYPERTIKVVYLVALAVISNAFVNMFNSIFQAFEKMEYVSIGRILNSSLMLVGALYAIRCSFDVVGFAFVYFLVSLIVLGYSFVVSVWKFVKPRIEVDLEFWKATIKEALPFGLSGIFVTIYYWTDSVMLSLMKGDEVVGWYNAAYRLVMILLFIPSILNIAIFPVMSRFYVSSKDSLRFAYEKYFKYMAMIGIPIGVGVTLLADKIILLIFGPEYLPSVVALQILVWSSVCIFMNGAFGRLLESLNKQIFVTGITGICAVENVVLNLIVIPKFSYIGASITTLITEFTALILGFILCARIDYGLSKNNILSVVKAIIASLLVGIFVIYYLKSLNLIILILFSAILYFLILYILKGFESEDIELFKNIMNIKTREVRK